MSHSSSFRPLTVYGDNYDTLRELYATLLGQRSTEINRIALYVGGVVETDYHVGRGNDNFKQRCLRPIRPRR